MRKPLHKVAIAMWGLATMVLLVWGWALFEFLLTWPIHTLSVGGFVMGGAAAAVLVALGTMIELLDQIRWNALSPEDRRQPVPIWTYVRRWPHSTRD